VYWQVFWQQPDQFMLVPLDPATDTTGPAAILSFSVIRTSDERFQFAFPAIYRLCAHRKGSGHDVHTYPAAKFLFALSGRAAVLAGF
jgi:hypothetical protein